ncbi:60S ribosome subunit biogenesis protein NIP7 [Sphaeroforma arctica JP610]|uniref:60S ribosome subunit biogenesis protein NIP7 homolog n=1 Tax=Sphaeroforma arctica JP610 TaxID=667725 RepID=A0A0L0FLL6_9EUKA|nr:60S ribosome subunit biogenesis protein NIP7 [Sphaeroforma arctica JP610]KNC77376.1 60S ribosome subunit biogenesis protein NIP7 [Sphaeroforma arctica JP610]|eukprot:XP_014151278.1 60S ribosome subunit biogenesis protein NIP7 [Sphaeroforma arctica JP610]
MRPLTEEETTVVFEKLVKYIGTNLKHMIDRADGNYVFRMQKDRVYYVREDIMLRATNIGREQLVSLGVCLGKFTGSGKFRLQITALPQLAQYAKYKVWLKPQAEQSFLYGNHVMKSGLGRITESTEQYSGVVIFNMQDTPLGFGVAAYSTADCRKVDPTATVAFHQCDIGQYLREEDTLM